jgi:hypothetical protein
MTVHYSRQFQVDLVFLFLFVGQLGGFLLASIQTIYMDILRFIHTARWVFFVRFKKYHTQPKLDNTQRTRIFPFGQGS